MMFPIHMALRAGSMLPWKKILRGRSLILNLQKQGRRFALRGIYSVPRWGV